MRAVLVCSRAMPCRRFPLCESNCAERFSSVFPYKSAPLPLPCRFLEACSAVFVSMEVFCLSIVLGPPPIPRISRSRLGGEKSKGYHTMGDLQGLGLTFPRFSGAPISVGPSKGRNPEGLSWRGYDPRRFPPERMGSADVTLRL